MAELADEGLEDDDWRSTEDRGPVSRESATGSRERPTHFLHLGEGHDSAMPATAQAIREQEETEPMEETERHQQAAETERED
mmetsp:Transcript_42015/g.106844  ORF Transcript_42015/g.106844 Transcript_42015/m.106844 type:complete len:82 (+) Transcript_42015:963-1208(+)